MGPPFPAEGPAAPGLPFSGANTTLPTPGPHLAPAINGDHRPLPEDLHLQKGLLLPQEAP